MTNFDSANSTRTGGDKSSNEMEELLGYAERTATSLMRASGKLEPTFLITAGDGALLVLLAAMDNDDEKELSAKIARLICVANRARAVVLVAEGWMSMSDEFDRPSGDPRRKEVVLLTDEGNGYRKHNILVVQRSKSGRVRGFKQYGRRGCDNFEGRFANILPTEAPTAEAEAEAKKLLEEIGMTPETVATNDVQRFWKGD